jgi:uncharacterized protein YndB with AHSA1/START domain
MDPLVTTGRTWLRIERLLRAPAEEVFAAWTDPALMAEWLSPTGYAEVEADVRVGGSFRVVMMTEGTRIEHTGEYLAVDPPRRLVFTWRSPYTGDLPSKVAVTFTPRGNDTCAVLVHDQLPAAVVPPHAGGWGTMVEHLAVRLDRASRPA